MTTMHTPPRNQGQIVDVSYGSDGESVYRRVYDRSDRSESWSSASWDDIWDAVPEGEEYVFEPWNGVPSLPRGVNWEPCDAPE